jgi:tRNA dimethylallyltransferase
LENSRSKTKADITLLAIVGATAVGKTRAAIEIAPSLDAEIISVDSMQVYRGMDIGTSKPTQEEQRRVPFHLIDVVDPRTSFSVASYKNMAEGAISDIASRGRRPLLVGGSGLYFRSVVDDLDFAHAAPDIDSRKKIEAELNGATATELHSLLQQVDPKAAADISPSNRRRVLRALEVARDGDRLVSERQRSWREYRSAYYLLAAGIGVERAVLYKLIDARVDGMISLGLEDEIKELSKRGLTRGTTAGEALGYRQMLDFVAGISSREEAVDEMKRRTRNYAKRQQTWFKKDPRIRWFRVEGDASDRVEDIEQSLLATARVVLEYMLDKLEN